MKITGVRTIPLSIPMRRTSRSQIQKGGQIASLLVQVQTDEGILGTGEAYASNGACAIVLGRVIDEILAPHILGEDPSNIEKLWDKMYRRTYSYGQKGLVIHGISGIEIALWDIIGKARNVPVYKLFGGQCHDRIKAYASLQPFAKPEDLVGAAKECLDQGFTAVKLHQKDVEFVRAIREALGYNFDVMFDANCAWSPQSAIKIAKKLGKYDVEWFEEPVWPPSDIDGLILVANATDIPVAAGENECTVYGFKELLTRRSVDIVQPDITKAGGLLECKKICSMAQALNIPFAPHCWCPQTGLVIALHLISSMSNGLCVEVPPPLTEDILEDPIRVEKGYTEVPEKPGLGIELRQDMIEEYLYRG